MRKEVHIVFDGPPGPESGRFVEVEDGQGHGISAGEWIERPDGLWALVIRAEDLEDEKRHIIQFDEDGWTLKHPVSCRPNLFDCPYTVAAQRDLINDVLEGCGRYYCDLANDGWIEVGESVEVESQ